MRLLDRCVFPSSSIKISLYRQHNVLHMLEDQEIGKFEGSIVSLLSNGKLPLLLQKTDLNVPKKDVEHHLDSRDSPNSTIRVNLSVDCDTTLQDPDLTCAIRYVETLWQNAKVHDIHGAPMKSVNMLGQAIKCIDDIVKFVEGLAEVWWSLEVCSRQPKAVSSSIRFLNPLGFFS
jgi:hypothetical protein